MIRSLRRALVAVVAAAVVAAAVVGGLRVFDKPKQVVASDAPDPVQTVTIKRTTLSLTRQLPGDLGYGSATTVKARATGTVTWLPPKGVKLGRGDVLFRVDDKPVILFFGATPLFRPLGPPKGAPAPDSKPLAGPDVAVVKANLAALGFMSKARTDRLTPGTVGAIKAWQMSLGVVSTGLIDPAYVVVLPAAVRVDTVKAELGDTSPTEILTVTGVQKVVTLTVPADDTDGVVTGNKVSVELPNGATSPGKVIGLSHGAANPDQSGGPADGDQKPQLSATIALGKPSATGAIDSGPVTVTIPGTTRPNVLAVPITALLALREGGYAVEVADGGRTTLIGVHLGMFADGNVEINGPGLRAGLSVVTTS